LKYCTRRTSDNDTSVTNESGVVANVVVAVGISLISYSVTEIQCTSGGLTAILFYASHLISANMRNHSNMLAPALFDKFSAKTFKYL
jgi:predicted cobalt transporter CbtA